MHPFFALYLWSAVVRQMLAPPRPQDHRSPSPPNAAT
jgi:hypothetical protein